MCNSALGEGQLESLLKSAQEEQAAVFRDKAIAGYRDFAERFPQSPKYADYVYRMAILYVEKGDFAAAEKRMQAVLARQATPVLARLARFSLAHMYIEMDRWEKASAVLSASLADLEHLAIYAKRFPVCRSSSEGHSPGPSLIPASYLKEFPIQSSLFTGAYVPRVKKSVL